MKTIQSKILITFIIAFFIIGFSTSAKSIFDAADSAVSEPTTTTEPGMEVNPLAVAYPADLQASRPHTANFIQSFCKKQRDYIVYIFKKGQRFFPIATRILGKYNVPSELQMIPVLESEFDPNAVSKVGAVGYWQFMGELATEYGLKITGKYDERKNFTKATVAAAKFFRDQLAAFNNDLLLCVASYNCGPGRVQYAIKKCGKPDACYWDIKNYLPLETKKFVMNFIAFNIIGANYDKFLNNTLDFNEPPFIKVQPIQDSINISSDSLTVRAL
ncbi:MAG TPA: lytic transglycosylase domain-containing protein [Chitinophagaceae bacterium]|nr:lytic transglycosylase domain-containing protein [Chitinophagaceae bacterium]